MKFPLRLAQAKQVPRADMARLMDWGVDGIITDDPVLLRQLMRERGLALPLQTKP
jgi:glycerophosphoryl diester phosphodiesterase